MSAQFVDDETIRVLLWAGLRSGPAGPLRWSVNVPGGSVVRALSEETASAVGDMLKAKNRQAMEDRYGDLVDEDLDDGDERDEWDDALAGLYVHRAPRFTTWSGVDVIVAAEFYQYQSFTDEDFDDRESVEAVQFLDALRRRVLPTVPGYGPGWSVEDLMARGEWEASPWGITEESVPPSGR